jgi:uncharacterized membrane protein
VDTDLEQTRNYIHPVTLLVTAVVGFLAAFKLCVDKVELLLNPATEMSCDLNAFVSCSGIMGSDQASLFGFPNPFLGIAGFAVVITLAVLHLAKVRLPEFIWAGLQVGVIAAAVFVSWLQWQSLYDIGKLCPYCMVVWACVIPMTVAVTTSNLSRWFPNSRAVAVLYDYRVLVTALWLVGVVSAIWFRFGENLWAGL